MRSLRARAALSVSLTVLVIVTTLTVVGFLLATQWTKTDQRDQLMQTAAGRLVIIESLGPDSKTLSRALGANVEKRESAFVRDGQWFTTPGAQLEAEFRKLTAGLRPDADLYVPNFATAEGSVAIVSLPTADRGGRLFDAFDTSIWTERLARTRMVIAVGAVITAIGGLAAGLLAGRRLARPLTDAAAAARAIAGGGLSTRLPPTDDPALADLTSTINEMVEALAARADMDRRFNSDVSHELRSPLTTLTASLAVLQSRRGELSAANRAALDLLAVDLQRFTRLVDDLLEISRVDGGLVSLVLSRVNVVEFLEEVVKSTRRSNINLVAPPLMRIFEMEIDKRRIARVLTNLIDNAFNHGAEPVLLTAVEFPPGALTPTHVRITVEDRGDGVDPDRAEELFERFNRGDRQTTTDGSGLGLALAREHVRLHGGTIGFEPVHRGMCGTRVVVVLPLSRVEGDRTETDTLSA